MRKQNLINKIIYLVKKYRRISIAELCKMVGLSYHYCRYSVIEPITILSPEIVLVKENRVEYVLHRPAIQVGGEEK